MTNPLEPKVVGELKILGYSSYLHPVGDDLVLGIGQDADENGVTLGLQISMFSAQPSDFYIQSSNFRFLCKVLNLQISMYSP